MQTIQNTQLTMIKPATTTETTKEPTGVEPPALTPAESAVKLLLTPREAAQALGIGTTLLYTLLTRHEIRSFKLGAARRIPLIALHEFIERQLEQEAC